MQLYVYVLFFVFSLVIFLIGTGCYIWNSPTPWIAGLVAAIGGGLFTADRSNTTVGFVAMVLCFGSGLVGFELSRFGHKPAFHAEDVVFAIFIGAGADALLFGAYSVWG